MTSLEVAKLHFLVAEEGEILPQSIESRDKFVAQRISDLLPNHHIFLPHTSCNRIQLDESIKSAGGEPYYIYGAELPDDNIGSTLKSIFHPVIGEAPEWFDHNLAANLKTSTLPGFTVFDNEPALFAAEQLLEKYTGVRLKHPYGSSGEDQWSALSLEQVREVLNMYKNLEKVGLVIEPNLTSPTAVSFTRTRMPEGFYYSMGLIIERPGTRFLDGVETEEQFAEYAGTTSLVSRSISNIVESANKSDTLIDPDGDEYSFRDVDVPHLAEIAKSFFSVHEPWQNQNNSHFNRTNIDVLMGEAELRDGGKEELVGVVDLSTRVGGASIPEIVGVSELRNGADYYIGSTRFTWDQKRRENLIKHPGVIIHYDGLDTAWYNRHITIGSYTNYVR